MNRLDHLVVTAPRLADGVRWVESILGVKISPGGKHVGMGTHNAVMRLGESQYLEVLARDPDQPRPAGPVWFDLDHLDHDAQPRLVAWVARVDDIRRATADCGYLPGPVREMSRGDFRWLIAVPEDGGLPAGGAAPMLIQWLGDRHPSAGLEDQGCRVSQLDILTAEPRPVQSLLDCLHLSAAVTIRRLVPVDLPRLVARFDTPRGPRSL